VIKNVLHKVKSGFVKNSILKHEKSYNHLKYCYYPEKKSRSLIIVFSGFPGEGQPAKYNYINTLYSIKANKLFLLDDVWNNVNVGSYYLGSAGNWYLINDICKLVSDIVADYKIDRVITVGSSKGGSSALFYGIKLGADACIIGAPQYYIGSYLSSEKHRPILEAMMGDCSQASIDKLDSLLSGEIMNEQTNRPDIYIHYSPKEHTYDEHIKDMLMDLEKNGYVVHEDNEYSYLNHSEVKDHFPSFLLKTIKVIIADND